MDNIIANRYTPSPKRFNNRKNTHCFLPLKAKVKTIAIERMPNEDNPGVRTGIVYLEVLRSSETQIVTRQVQSCNILGATMNQRLKNEVVWSRETLRQLPYDDSNYEYYRIFQEMPFLFADAF